MLGIYNIFPSQILTIGTFNISKYNHISHNKNFIQTIFKINYTLLKLFYKLHFKKIKNK